MKNISYIHYIARLKQITEDKDSLIDKYLNITSKFILNKFQSLEKEESQSIYEKVIEKLNEKVISVTLDHIYKINQEIITLIGKSDEIFLKIDLPNKIHELECLSINDLDSSDYENIIKLLKKCESILTTIF